MLSNRRCTLRTGPFTDATPLEKDTIVIERRDGLWRMRVHPDLIQLFESRELAEAHAKEIACSHIPAWTVIVESNEPQPTR